ncbi:MAG: bifunctional 4-hydroxy-2-oxoglutarate aldolase/2-dehydro-3-deoxy-phosphogluconate aldolase [Spirochaetaceae bacterium]|nr:bifunctional 4-hydroxy-2-oxoglutarate aldolase/2-dehydro-3-deoxy-phosphogluconate aldolase [Spirochaetaceae bacterium]
MKQEEIFYNTGIIPVIKIDKAEKALPLAEALLKAGIPIAEITFRSDAAEKGISLLKKNMKEILVGAGTVLTSDQLERAIGAGADFIVTPGYNPDIVENALALNKLIYPGVNSPSQVEIALSKGLKVLKFFPAEVSGGIAMMKALQPVYNVKFIPTGGINLGNIIKYLECKNVVACGGTWMVSPELIENENYDEVYRLSKEAVDVISQLRSSNGK